MGQCKFDTAWVGKCKNEAIPGNEYCEEHSKVKCSVCGEQATHDCDLTDVLVCGSPLCDSAKCRLQHLKRSHGGYRHMIKYYENALKIPHSEYVIARAIYNPATFPGLSALNDKLVEHYEVLRIELLNPNEVEFIKCSSLPFAKNSDEMLEYVRKFHKNVESKFYISDSILYRSEATPKLIIDTFVPVILNPNNGGMNNMMVTHKLKNSSTEVSIETKDINSNTYKIKITRDCPSFNHAYSESINLSLEDAKALSSELNTFLEKYIKV